MRMYRQYRVRATVRKYLLLGRIHKDSRWWWLSRGGADDLHSLVLWFINTLTYF